MSNVPFPIDSHCHLRFPNSQQTSTSCCCDDDSNSVRQEEEEEKKPVNQHVIIPVEQFINNNQQQQFEQTSLFCSTSPNTDWDEIEKLLTSSNKKGNPTSSSYFGFGIHPWWVSSLGGDVSSSSWQDRLCQLLTKFPSAIVGEIGLDKVITADKSGKSSSISIFEKQIEIFEVQMDIAALMKRPVSVHCVRAQGPMLELLGRRPIEKYPSSFIFHGFTGSTEFVKSILKLNKGRGSRFYFGFCSATTGTLKHFLN